jgi:hypothetical protein
MPDQPTLEETRADLESLLIYLGDFAARVRQSVAGVARHADMVTMRRRLDYLRTKIDAHLDPCGTGYCWAVALRNEELVDAQVASAKVLTPNPTTTGPLEIEFTVPSPCLHGSATIRCPCGAHAFTVVLPLHDGDAYNASGAFAHPDGRPVQDGEPIACPVCGRAARGLGTDGVLR